MSDCIVDEIGIDNLRCLELLIPVNNAKHECNNKLRVRIGIEECFVRLKY
jgi:hypothetical protein